MHRFSSSNSHDGTFGLRYSHAHLFDSLKSKVDYYQAPQRSSTVDHKRRVLLVDDVSVNQQIAHAALHRLGFTCDEASNGAEAIALFRKRAYNIILMDVQLPELDGIQATTRIRILEQQCAQGHCTIYGLTKTCDDISLLRYNQAGMDGCIEKGCVLSRATLEALSITQENPSCFVFINCRNVQSVRPLIYNANLKSSSPFILRMEEKHSRVTRKTKRSFKILLVDDIRVTQRINLNSLTQSGYACDSAPDGCKAVLMARNSEYHLILMDVQLPFLDGMEATKKIRSLELTLNRKPAIVLGLTGSCSVSNLVLYRDSGMNGCIEKGCIVIRAVVESLNTLENNRNQFLFIDAKNMHSHPFS